MTTWRIDWHILWLFYPPGAPRDCEIVTSAPTLLINDNAFPNHVKKPATPDGSHTFAAQMSQPDHVGHAVCHLNKRGRDQGNSHTPHSLLILPCVRSFILSYPCVIEAGKNINFLSSPILFFVFLLRYKR